MSTGLLSGMPIVKVRLPVRLSWPFSTFPTWTLTKFCLLIMLKTGFFMWSVVVASKWSLILLPIFSMSFNSSILEIIFPIARSS